jgi:hypothetical protein
MLQSPFNAVRDTQASCVATSSSASSSAIPRPATTLADLPLDALGLVYGFVANAYQRSQLLGSCHSVCEGFHRGLVNRDVAFGVAFSLCASESAAERYSTHSACIARLMNRDDGDSDAGSSTPSSLSPTDASPASDSKHGLPPVAARHPRSGGVLWLPTPSGFKACGKRDPPRTFFDAKVMVAHIVSNFPADLQQHVVRVASLEALPERPVVRRSVLSDRLRPVYLLLRDMHSHSSDKEPALFPFAGAFLPGGVDWHSLRSVDVPAAWRASHFGHGFLDGCANIRHLSLPPLRHLTSVGFDFLRGCIHLADVDLRCFEVLAELPSQFMTRTGVASIDTRGMRELRSVCDEVFAENKHLTSVDLSDWTEVASIGNSFLFRCNVLERVGISGVWKLRSIGSYFLMGCSSLVSIDLSSLVSLTAIGEGFLSGCVALRHVCLSGLTNLTTVPSGFLSGCSAIRTLDLSPLRNVSVIAQTFLHGCSGLTSLDLSEMKALRFIDSGFGGLCSSLTSVNLRGLDGVVSIGDRFLYGCKLLVDVDLTPLSSMRTVGKSFMSKCTSLRSVDGRAWQALVTMGDCAFGNCDRLTRLDLSGLGLTSIPNSFAASCPALETVDLSGLTHVAAIGERFLLGCESLVDVNLSGLTSVATVGTLAFDGCSRLSLIDLHDWQALTSVAPPFAHTAPGVRIVPPSSGAAQSTGLPAELLIAEAPSMHTTAETHAEAVAASNDGEDG